MYCVSDSTYARLRKEYENMWKDSGYSA